MGYPQISCFKSLVKDIISTDDIKSELDHPLCYQYKFKKHVSHFEKNEWRIFEKHINGFTIDPAMIDRLYHLYSKVKEDVYDHDHYELFCRMWYEGVPYFVAMMAEACAICGFDCVSCSCTTGDILFCKSPNFFLQHMFCSFLILTTMKRLPIKYICLFYKTGIEFPNHTIHIIFLLSLGEMCQC